MKPVIPLFFSSLFLFHSFNASAANRFWVSAVASNWNNTANWSNVSGGAGGFSIPGVGDAVIFNNARVGNCTLDIPGTVLSFTINASGNKMELNISELKTGIYFLYISHDGVHETRKIVVRK
jgi:hypothetical protein